MGEYFHNKFGISITIYTRYFMYWPMNNKQVKCVIRDRNMTSCVIVFVAPFIVKCMRRFINFSAYKEALMRLRDLLLYDKARSPTVSCRLRVYTAQRFNHLVIAPTNSLTMLLSHQAILVDYCLFLC